MKLFFKAKTNKDYVMINLARFKLKDGGVIELDRNITRYSVEDGVLYMEWQGIYLWTINDVTVDAQLDNEEIVDLLRTAELEFELEEDSDEDYEVTDPKWSEFDIWMRY